MTSAGLVVLKMHVVIRLQPSLDLFDRGRIRFKEVIDVVTAIEVLGRVGKLAAAELLNFVELSALSFDFFADRADEVVDAAINPLRVEDDQAFVIASHGLGFPVLD